LLIALANLDEVIRVIRNAADADDARDQLISRFNLSERQSQAILDLQLRRLAALERQKIVDEQRQTLERIGYLEDLLSSPRKILELIKTDTQELAEKYGDPRRTHIAHEASEAFSEEDLVPDEAVLISITQRGYIKRVAAKAFRAQGRGGRGVTGHLTRDEDEVLMLIPARSLDTILFFSDRGKVYSEKAYQIPDADRTARGIPIVNILALDANETITAAVAVPKFGSSQYIILATRSGRIKRMSLSELASVRPSGLIAITLENGDRMGWARLTNGSDEVILVTEQGQALRFSEQEVRPMGRSAGGVTAIRLKHGDYVTSMDVVEPNGFLMVVTKRGFGKRVPLSEYPVKGRATGGVVTIDKNAMQKIGAVTSARVVQAEDDLTIMSSSGVFLRTKVKDVSQMGRSTRGVTLIVLKNGDSVASMARIAAADLRAVGVQPEAAAA
jgi:DNA gyrase subunit A